MEGVGSQHRTLGLCPNASWDIDAAWLKYLSRSLRGLFHTVSSIIHHFYPDSHLLMRTPFVPTPSLSRMLHLSLNRTNQNPRLAHFVMGSSSLSLRIVLFFSSSLPFPHQWIPSGYKHGLISSSFDGPSSGPIFCYLHPSLRHFQNWFLKSFMYQPL